MRQRIKSFSAKTPKESAILNLEESFLSVYDEPQFAGEIMAKKLIDQLVDEGGKILYEKYLESKMAAHVTDSIFGVMKEMLRTELTRSDQILNDQTEPQETEVFKSGYDTFSNYAINIEDIPQKHSKVSIAEIDGSQNPSVINRMTFFSQKSKLLKNLGSSEVEKDNELSKTKKRRLIEDQLVSLKKEDLSEIEAKEAEDEMKFRAYKLAQSKQRSVLKSAEEEERLKEKKKEDGRKKLIKELETKPFTFDYDGQPIMLAKKKNNVPPPVVIPVQFQIKTQKIQEKSPVPQEVQNASMPKYYLLPEKNYPNGNDKISQNGSVGQIKLSENGRKSSTGQSSRGGAGIQQNSKGSQIRDGSLSVKGEEVPKVSFLLNKSTDDLYNPDTIKNTIQSQDSKIGAGKENINKLSTITKISSAVKIISQMRRSSKLSDGKNDFLKQGETSERKRFNSGDSRDFKSRIMRVEPINEEDLIIEKDLMEQRAQRDREIYNNVKRQTSLIPYIKMSQGVKLTEFKNGEEVVITGQETNIIDTKQMTKKQYQLLIEQGNRISYKEKQPEPEKKIKNNEIPSSNNEGKKSPSNNEGKKSPSKGIMRVSSKEQKRGEIKGKSANAIFQTNLQDMNLTFSEQFHRRKQSSEQKQEDKSWNQRQQSPLIKQDDCVVGNTLNIFHQTRYLFQIEEDILDKVNRPQVIRDRQNSSRLSRNRAMSTTNPSFLQQNKQMREESAKKNNNIDLQNSAIQRARAITYEEQQEMTSGQNKLNTTLPLLPAFIKQKHDILKAQQRQLEESKLNKSQQYEYNQEKLKQSSTRGFSVGNRSKRQNISTHKKDVVVTFGKSENQVLSLLISQ